MIEESKAIALVELDAIMDTRLGTLILNRQDVAVQAFKEGKYHHRYNDTFNGLISLDEFTSYYNKRNALTIRNSTLTSLIHILKDFVKSAPTLALDNPAIDTSDTIVVPEIWLNTHPYVLSEEDKRMLQIGLSKNLDARVVLVDYPDERLSPEYLRDNIMVLMMYNPHYFLEKQYTELESRISLADISLYTPMLIHGELPGKHVDIPKLFKDHKGICAPIIDFEFLPSLYFSSIIPQNNEIHKDDEKGE